MAFAATVDGGGGGACFSLGRRLLAALKSIAHALALFCC